VLRDAVHPAGLASVVRDAPALVVQGGLERRPATEISIVERRALHWLWAARAREDSHERLAAKDSNLVWERTSLERWDALPRRVVLRPQEKPQAAQMQEVASQQASAPREPAEQQVLE